MKSAAELLQDLRDLDETRQIEAKAGSAAGRALMETVVAFANEPGMGGGYLLLGVEADDSQLALFDGQSCGPQGYRVVGVDDPDRLQGDIATQCASMLNRPVRPLIWVETLEQKPVVVVHVDEAAPADKPIYLKRLGLPRGAFRRIGAADLQGTDDDLLVLYQRDAGATFDASIIADAEIAELSTREIALYRELRRRANPHAEELTWTDHDLLRALRAIDRDAHGVWRPTVAGLLLFGEPMALRRCLPMMRIDYVRVPGRQWVEDPDRRFDTVEIRAPLLTAVRRVMAAITDDMLMSFSLPEGHITRTEVPQLPERVLREAVVNAVMHRSYRIYGPILVIRYANRIEIRNPGHSLKAVESLGEPGSQTRNRNLAAVFHDVRYAEAKGSGIRAMQRLMNEAGLIPPAFESSRRSDQFVATLLFHHLLGRSDVDWLAGLTSQPLSDEEARALIFVREMGAIDNATYRSLNRVDTLSASQHLRRLRDLDLLVMKGRGSSTYYLPGPALGDPDDTIVDAADPTQVGADVHMPGVDPTQVGADVHMPGVDPAQVGAEVHMADPDVHMADPDVHMPDPNVPQLPPALRARLAQAGTRPRRANLRHLIQALCAWRPWSARELARLLNNRDPRNLQRAHLAAMIDDGRLVHTIPQMPKHPDQRYTIPSPDTE